MLLEDSNYMYTLNVFGIYSVGFLISFVFLFKGICATNWTYSTHMVYTVLLLPSAINHGTKLESFKLKLFALPDYMIHHL